MGHTQGGGVVGHLINSDRLKFESTDQYRMIREIRVHCSDDMSKVPKKRTFLFVFLKGHTHDAE